MGRGAFALQTVSVLLIATHFVLLFAPAWERESVTQQCTFPDPDTPYQKSCELRLKVEVYVDTLCVSDGLLFEQCYSPGACVHRACGAHARGVVNDVATFRFCGGVHACLRVRSRTPRASQMWQEILLHCAGERCPAETQLSMFTTFQRQWNMPETVQLMWALNNNIAYRYFELMSPIKHLLIFAIIVDVFAIGFMLQPSTRRFARRCMYISSLLILACVLIWGIGRPKFDVMLNATTPFTMHVGPMFILACVSLCLTLLFGIVDETALLRSGRVYNGVLFPLLGIGTGKSANAFPSSATAAQALAPAQQAKVAA